MSVSYDEALACLSAVASTLHARLHRQLDDPPSSSSSPGISSSSTSKSPPGISVTLEESLNRISAKDVYSILTLPPLDNSAMDGYAISSKETIPAAHDTSVRLKILGSIAAGDQAPTYSLDPAVTESNSCWIINTGGPFPVASPSTTTLPSPLGLAPSSSHSDGLPDSETRFDACLRKEDGCLVRDPATGNYYVELCKPVRERQHRRLAGEDYSPNDAVVKKGDLVTPERIAALSSHGMGVVEVMPQVKIAVLSTGKELEALNKSGAHTSTEVTANDHSNDQMTNDEAKSTTEPSPPTAHIYDSNSHYVSSALRSWGYNNITRLKSLGDDPEEFANALKKAMKDEVDVLVTTGGVSKGQHDYIESALVSLGAKIHYHGTRMRPGHPALLATLDVPSCSRSDLYTGSGTPAASVKSIRKLAVFGLPGNPCAAAATLRFMVNPFLRIASGRQVERCTMKARLVLSDRSNGAVSDAKNGHAIQINSLPEAAAKHKHVTTACGGNRSGNNRSYLISKYTGYTEEGILKVTPLNRGSGMVKPLSMADCWILIPEDQKEEDGIVVECYPLMQGLG